MPSQINIVTDAGYTISATGKKVLLEVTNSRASCTTPNWSLLRDPKEPLAMDVEFQEHKGKGAEKWGHRMGRIAVVNTKGQTIYDVYVQYDYDPDVKTKMPPPVFGVTRKDLSSRNGAKESWEVEENLRKMFHGREIVGHGMRLDLTAVGDVWDENHSIVDTQHIYGQVKLSTLASEYLTGSFNFHDPTEDARATMLLYLLYSPYKGRTGFGDAPLLPSELDQNFPPLGS